MLLTILGWIIAAVGIIFGGGALGYFMLAIICLSRD